VIDVNDVKRMWAVIEHKAFNWGKDCVIEMRKGSLFCTKCEIYIE